MESSMDLSASTVLVTGANRGFGQAFAAELLGRGATVHAGARDLARVDLPGVEPIAVDITDPVSVEAAARATGDVTVLINNAGLEAGVTEEGELQVAIGSQAIRSVLRDPGQTLHLRLAPVGQLTALEVGPQSLDRVQLGRVRGQAPHLEPVPLLGQELAHQAAPVRGQPVPDQDHLLAPEVPAQFAHELDQRVLVVGALPGLEVESGPSPVPAVGEGGGHRDPLPVEPMAEDRGLAPGCPGAPDHRRQRGSALVLEDDPGLLPASVFLSRA